MPQAGGTDREILMRWKVKETTYDTVAAYVEVVQRNTFVLVGAGVVVHQHTRLLMHDLRERADNSARRTYVPVWNVSILRSVLLREQRELG